MERENRFDKPWDGTTQRGEDAVARTDLACEAGRPERAREEVRKSLSGEGELHILRCTETDGKNYVTLSTPKLTHLGERGIIALVQGLAEELTSMAEAMLRHPLDPDTRILVAGLGNPDMTPDAIGPFTVRGITATRHLRQHDAEMYAALGCCELSAVAPGVLGQTGVESGNVIQGVVKHVKPHLLIAVDALAARSCERLASTVQLSDHGIGPGAGVGNHRMAVDAESMGCPVLALGVPTVVDSATLVYDALGRAGIDESEISPALRDVLGNGRSFVVSPKDCDRITEIACRVLSGAIDNAFGVGEL